MKFGFDLRNTDLQAGSFKYNDALTDSGDVIFMRNCQTIILRVGATALTSTTSGTTTINARL